MTTDTISPLTLSTFQNWVLSVPVEIDLALVGGRGGGKTVALIALALRHCAEHAALARVLVVRQTFPGLVDFESTLRELVPRAFEGASYNAQAHIWRLPNGATIELGILEGAADLARYQGRNFSLLLADEAGEWSDFALVDRLRANLRAPAGVSCRFVLAANPGGAGHAGLTTRFANRDPWVPFTDKRTGSTFVTCPSTYRDNEFLDRDAYAAQLSAATAGDPELAKAWLNGDWTIARGAFFASVLSDDVALDSEAWSPESFDAWAANQYGRPRRHLSLAHDFGVAAPSVTLVILNSDGWEGPDGRYYPRGSLLALDELATHEPESLTRGLGWTVPRLADEIRALCGDWGMVPDGVADDAIFARAGGAAGSISDELRAARVYFRPSGKADRRAGWEMMRRMLAAASSPDVPALYVSRRCAYTWATLPSLPRDPRRIEDLDSRSADHAADALRYAVTGAQPSGWRTSTVSLIGY